MRLNSLFIYAAGGIGIESSQFLQGYLDDISDLLDEPVFANSPAPFPPRSPDPGPAPADMKDSTNSRATLDTPIIPVTQTNEGFLVDIRVRIEKRKINMHIFLSEIIYFYDLS